MRREYRERVESGQQNGRFQTQAWGERSGHRR
jgi:hypothetical protein